MTAKTGEETNSNGRWFGEDFEQMGRAGSTVPRFDETEDGHQSKSREDEINARQFYRQPESNQRRPPVTMETASTDSSDKIKTFVGEEDLYTSLLSNQNSPSQQRSVSDPKSGALIQDGVTSLETTHGMFSSDSGIEMTPGESVDFTRKLLESEKMEAYNYMDISPEEKPRPLVQEQAGGWEDVSQPGIGQYLEKSSAPMEVETIGPALGSQTFPYVEEPSDEELDDQPGSRRERPLAAGGPIKITLTEMDPESPAPQCPAVSDRNSILSLGLQGIPTVTLSEPEDDSPSSSTPPLTEESDSPCDPILQARGVGTVGSAQDQTSSMGGAPKPPGPPAETGVKPAQTEPDAPSKPSTMFDQDGSSAESGDSEIELVSEDPPSRKQPSSPAHTAPVPTPSVATPLVPSIQYSILREEREAELDSELLLESFDAAEESPKRVGGLPVQKNQRVESGRVDGPSVPAPASPAVPVLAPTIPSAPQKEKSSAEKILEPLHIGGTPATKPQAPSVAMVSPDVRRDEPSPEEKGGKKRRASEGRRDLEETGSHIFILPAEL
ncbi:hypothetical protein GJAV_G00108750 [Gymnothorax javanicus]|nr:hypothetical protein GJAV_G00108750 [Gymnothorax javanicus]